MATPAFMSSSIAPSIVSGPRSPALLNRTLHSLIDEKAAQQSDHLAIISTHQRRELSFRDLRNRSQALAVSLHGVGVGKGDRVALLLGNTFELVEIWIACSRLGAYCTFLNHAYTTPELLVAIELTKPSVLFVSPKTSKYNYSESLEAVRRSKFSPQRIVTIPERRLGMSRDNSNYAEYPDLDAKVSDVETASKESITAGDGLSLLFTSGSTGRPKAATLTHTNVVNSARYIALQMKVTSNDTIAVPVPLFHAFGLIMGLCVGLIAGATTVLPCEYFDAGQTLAAVQQYSCTGLYGVTTMFVDYMSHPDFAKTVKRSLRFALMAGSSMPQGLLAKVGETFPIAEIYTNWGMTELTSAATMTTAHDPLHKKLQTAGRLFPNFVAKIVDPETSRTLPWGQRGEIVVSGFGVMNGYFADPERTAQAIRIHENDAALGPARFDETGRPRRWMHTGDEGYLDAQGYFVITGRIKDLIIRGGENISPVEIETALSTHPSVQQAAVIAVPSDRYGEEVAAVIEWTMTSGAPSDSRAREVTAWLRGKLARSKVPKHVWWVGPAPNDAFREWPKTANGKIKKDILRKRCADLLQKSDDSSYSSLRALL